MVAGTGPEGYRYVAARRGEKNGYSDLAGLVDHVVRDAGAWESDEAARQEVQQDVVSPEGRGLAVATPVGFANNFYYLDLYRPGYLNNVLILLNIIYVPETYSETGARSHKHP